MVKEVTYVIGHKNPDTDSICSAIAYAELKNSEGGKNIEAARAGDMNPQTAFILRYFNIDPPKLLPNVYPKARDIMTTEVEAVSAETPLIKVMETIRDKNVRFIPVVDEHRRPVGILTPMDLADRNISQIEAETSRKVFTSIGNIVATLDASVCSDILGDRMSTFSVFVGAMEEESFLKVLGERNAGECVVIVGDREKIQKLSVERKIALLIITGGLKVSSEIIDLARGKGVSIIISPYDSATTALLVRMSTPAREVCNGQFEKADPDDLVEDLKYRMTNSMERGIVVLNKENILEGIITKSNLLKDSGTNLILVDHNELSQAVDGADRVRIKEVVDHHRLGNFHTTYPITFMCEPVGSTSTLVAERYRDRNIKIRKQIAGILLGGVISDTVILKSPTTTARDHSITTWLEEKAGLDHALFGREIFAATSSIKKRGPRAVVNSDFKTFEAKDERFGVGQVEIIGFEEFFEEKEKLVTGLLSLKDEKGLKLSALLVTDIVLGTSLLLAVGEKKIIYGLDYPKVEESVYELKNVISRKKQVVPHLISLFKELY